MKASDQKPESVYLANVESAGRVRFIPSNLFEAIKELDRRDYLHMRNTHVQIETLRDVLKTWDKGTAKNPHIAADMTITPEGVTLREYPEDQPRNAQFLKARETTEGTDFVCTLSLTDQQPERTQPDKWLSLAIPKGKEAEIRPTLAKVYGSFAADGFRLHHDLTLPDPDPAESPVDWRAVYPKPSDNLAIVNNAGLTKALKMAKTINRDMVRLYFNGRMDITGTSEETGQVSTSIPAGEGYEHTGLDMLLGIRPQFVLDALSGMGDEVIISLTNPNAPILITDGKREAVIMPMCLK